MVSPHHVVKIVTALSAVALAASVAVAPAYALQDIAIEDAVAQSGSVTADNGVVMQSDDQSDDQTGDQQSQDSMPDNPNAKLPDNVSDEISDDATVISEDLAATPEGEVKNIETGEIVTDPTLVGTKDQQPDPLAKTNGESFIPVSAEDVKNAVADANVQLSKFESNEYGAHWGTYNNSKAFFDYQNNLFVQQAKGVIDVSGWQGDIDWAKAKADGVEGVIIRLGYAKTTWVAQYGARMGFDSFPTNSRGWQYTSTGKVDGISGNVDMNAFGNKEYVNGGSSNSATSYEVKGNMGVEWRSIGAEKSVIGKPIANEVCDWTQGRVNCYQNFENGAISWTPSTGAHYTTGAIRKEWARRNYEHGVLGYPIEDEKKLSNDWKYQRFQNGDIWSRGTKESRIVLYNLRDSFYKNGGYSSLGGPVADEESMGRGWWRQRFQYGDVWSKDGTNYRFVIKFDLRDSWNQHRGFSWLGAPVANEENMGNGYWRQRCENGDVWTRNGASEKYIVMLNLRDSFYKNGGYSSLGGPVADEESMGRGWWRQRFQYGDVWSKDGTNYRFVIKFDLRDSWNQHRGFSWLGAPVANEENMGNGYWRQRCENGDVWTRNGASEKYIVMLNLRKEYYAKGGFSKLGGPVSEERNLGSIWRQDFQKGSIYAH